MKYLFIAFIFISTLIRGQNLDYKILKSINQSQLPIWDKSMRVVSNSIYPVMPLAVAGLWYAGYQTKNDTLKRNAYKSALGIGLAIGLSSGLKYLVNRARPFKDYPNEIVQRDFNVGPYSFPSGHTTSAFATATCLSLSTKKWYITVPAFTYASLVGDSRMRLGVHYPSDVLAGMLIGIGSGLMTWKIDKMMNKK